MTLPLPSPSVEPVHCRGIRSTGRRCGLVLVREPWRSLGMGEDCAGRAGVVPVRPMRAARVGTVDDPTLFDADPLAVSIAAYTDHVDAYAARYGGRMADEVQRMVGLLPSGAKILDAGCGPGRDLARFTAAGLTPQGVDLNEAMLEAAATHGPVLHADLRDLPLSDDTFAAVWACASLVHLDPAGTAVALTELRRVTNAGGWLFVEVKAAGGGWQDTIAGRRWFQVWTPAQFATAVEASGWQMVEVTAADEFIDVWARKEADDQP